MAEHFGIVIKNESDQYAQVITKRRGGCEGCESTPHGCSSCLVNTTIKSRVTNPVGAKPGDLVKIQLSSSLMFTGAAILYLLPILGLLLGAFAGDWASGAYGLTGSLGSIGGAAAGLCLGYIAVIILDRRPSIRKRIMPTITAIKTPKSGLPHTAHL